MGWYGSCYGTLHIWVGMVRAMEHYIYGLVWFVLWNITDMGWYGSCYGTLHIWVGMVRAMEHYIYGLVWFVLWMLLGHTVLCSTGSYGLIYLMVRMFLVFRDTVLNSTGTGSCGLIWFALWMFLVFGDTICVMFHRLLRVDMVRSVDVPGVS